MSGAACCSCVRFARCVSLAQYLELIHLAAHRPQRRLGGCRALREHLITQLQPRSREGRVDTPHTTRSNNGATDGRPREYPTDCKVGDGQSVAGAVGDVAQRAQQRLEALPPARLVHDEKILGEGARLVLVGVF
jgi:hypothetical protein